MLRAASPYRAVPCISPCARCWRRGVVPHTLARRGEKMASDTLNAAHRHPFSVCASLTAAALYAGVSVIMVLSNKALLSSWRFDFTATLLLLQNSLTLGALALLRPASAFSGTLRAALSFPAWDASIARRTAPLAMAYLANVACGLAALRLASVPVYQVLKRLAPLPAMLLDAMLRGATFSRETRASIALVAGGAVLTLPCFISHGEGVARSRRRDSCA